MKDEREHLQLFDLIARDWTLPSPATRLTFNRAGTAVAFDCVDGSIHLGATADKASSNSRIRRAADTGRLTIQPRTKPFPPLKTAEYTKGRSSGVVAFGEQNFAFAKDNGRINLLTPGGTAMHLEARAPSRITALAAAPDGDTVAFACDDGVFIGSAMSGVTHSLSAPHAADLAFSPDGRTLAAVHAAGLSRWAVAEPDHPTVETALPAPPHTVTWRDDGNWLVCCMGTDGICVVDATTDTVTSHGGFPAPATTAAFGNATNTVVASGAFRVAGWSLAETPHENVTTGRAGLVLIDAVATCPTRNLAAVGYANGLVSLAEIGRREEILLREDTGVGIAALGFSPDGKFLAIAGVDASAALVEFPEGMFKS